VARYRITSLGSIISVMPSAAAKTMKKIIYRKARIVSKAIVAIQYGTILHPMTFNAYFSFPSLSSTGYPAIVAAERQRPKDSSSVTIKLITAPKSSGLTLDYYRRQTMTAITSK